MHHEPRLVEHAELAAWGYSARGRRVAVERGLLVPLRRGIFAVGEDWRMASPEERIVARAKALERVSTTSPIFSHETAAAVHGLPLYSPDPRRVHTIAPHDRPGAARDVVRHRGEVPDDDLVVIDGLHCTSLRRTVADVARNGGREQAVTIADAALRLCCTPAAHRYDDDLARAFREGVVATARRSAHGSARAERVMRFADGRAQLPGESVSRVRLAQLGFRPPRLQVPVPSPGNGRWYYVDFALDDAPALGEFDGRIKYEDGRLLTGRTPDEVFEAEKQREDWIRGVTGRSLVRWGWSHLTTAAALGERLAAFGVHSSA